ncbi:MAG TPA: lytic transglycosylase domain-containing protein [Chthoniobacteraceae bacterium]|jgi:soluble lytic murein transglycosylase|nr:lytic transglycosylase domain-containing protein [Chthoniobacteraceae bacterium]
MLRTLGNFTLVTLLALMAACALLICGSQDPLYTTQSLLSRGRYHRYDTLIREVGAEYHVDPMLIKAVAWRESGFRPGKVGKNGERGLMQVMEAAASDWAKQKKRAGFVPDDLFDPHTNLEAGTWYLKKALTRYASKDDPMTFALAEYNAGKSRVDKWVGDTNQGAGATAGDLRDSISFPSTREYVDTIIDRYRFYQHQGHL